MIVPGGARGNKNFKHPSFSGDIPATQITPVEVVCRGENLKIASNIEDKLIPKQRVERIYCCECEGVCFPERNRRPSEGVRIYREIFIRVE